MFRTIFATTVVLCAMVFGAAAEPKENLPPAALPLLAKRYHVLGNNLGDFDKWNTFIADHEKLGGLSPDQALFAKKLTSLSVRNMLIRVQHFVSKSGGYHYASDQVIYGVEDYWAPPRLFRNRKRGDCEDFALLKYMLLRGAGIPATSLYVTLVTKTGLPTPHMILIVALDEKTLIVLDNFENTPKIYDQDSPYRLMYAVNEDGWWLLVQQQILARARQ